MIIGVPREIKPNEYRVSITPPGVNTLFDQGHTVLIEAGAGTGSGISDDEYRGAGAAIKANAAEIFMDADLILKVKEIFPEEFDLLREDLILFTYLHSANNPPETQALLDNKVIAIAYEDLVTDDGQAPLLTPMSEIAGEVGLLMGAYHMFTTQGGGGKLIGGAVGVAPAHIAILGAGNVGLGAARYAMGLGADVTLFDIDLNRLREVRQKIFPGIKTEFLNRLNLSRLLPHLDMLINGVMWPPGAKGHIVTREMLKLLRPTCLIVDIACDPAGAIETCRATTHNDPVYEVDGIRHFCVDNLPSAVANTASSALSNATLPYVLKIAALGWQQALRDDAVLRRGLGFAKGHLTFKPTADAQGREYTPVETVLNMTE